jgi:hypothetical protein
VLAIFKPTVTLVTYSSTTSFLQFGINWQDNSQQMNAGVSLAMFYVLGWFNATF